MGVARLELAHPLRITDFKSVASTIPPHPQVYSLCEIGLDPKFQLNVS
jgi:hypothetical protein